MSGRTLKLAVLGVGRMGTRHAINVMYRTPRAELVAVSDPRPTQLQWAGKELPGVKAYQSARECLDKSGADGVVIASETGLHAELAREAMKRGMHVLVEKPISIDLETSRQVVEDAEARPDLKVMVGFSRRFDESYREAKRLIDEAKLGVVHQVNSATCDMLDPTGFFVQYSKASGGIFIDCGIHDIDLSRLLLSIPTPSPLSPAIPKKQVRRVFASGQNVAHPELAEYGDCDNAQAFVEYENGKMLQFRLSRTGRNGHECHTEIVGTGGTVLVNRNPRLNRVEVRDEYGVRCESTPTYYERFQEAFVTEMNDFTACVLDDKPLPVLAADALEATKIAAALTESFRRNKVIQFGDDGEAILD